MCNQSLVLRRQETVEQIFITFIPYTSSFPQSAIFPQPSFLHNVTSLKANVTIKVDKSPSIKDFYCRKQLILINIY